MIARSWRTWRWHAAAIMLAALTACTKPAPAAAGRRVFAIKCGSCHNLNPHLDGSLGPAIAGSPRALVDARVLHQAYPPGDKPKRATHLMRTMPWLEPAIDDLTADLAAAQKAPK